MIGEIRIFQVTLKVVRTHSQHPVDRVLDLDVPGRAIRREVAGSVRAEDERPAARFGLVGDVGEAAHGYDLAIRPIGRDELLRITIKRIHAQRDSVVEQPEAAAYRCLLFRKRGHSQADARRDSECFRYALILEACADVYSQFRSDDPVILSEAASLDVGAGIFAGYGRLHREWSSTARQGHFCLA